VADLDHLHQNCIVSSFKKAQGLVPDPVVWPVVGLGFILAGGDGISATNKFSLLNQ
jgi:hypothetical protein